MSRDAQTRRHTKQIHMITTLGTSQNLSWGGGGENGGSRNFLKELDGGPESFEDKLRGGN